MDSLSDLSAVNPTPEQVETAGKFMHDASSINANERTRRNMTFRYLQELLGVSIQSEVTLEDKLEMVSLSPAWTPVNWQPPSITG